MIDTAFDVQNITYRYNGDVTALDGISLAIESGKRAAILGANGSGKSTLLRILDGLYFPDSGGVSVFGEPLTEERLQDEAFAFGFRRQVAFVFQNPDVQLFNPTVFDEVAFGPLQLRWKKEEVRDRVGDALNRLNIYHLKDRIPHRLSGGEKKRVALASVLVLDPQVLLLDEPAAALDPRSHSQLIDLLVEWGDGAKTVITATHDLRDLTDIADRCYVLDVGKLVAERPPAEVLRDADLLRRTNLIHEHRHAGGVHSHPHVHSHDMGD